MNKVHFDIYSILQPIQDCCEKYDVNKLYVFGSATTPNYCKANSDLDILIQIDDSKIRNLIRIKTELQRIAEINIDLFKADWIKTEEMLNYLIKYKVSIYDKENTVTNIAYHEHSSQCR